MKHENLRRRILKTGRCNPGGTVHYHLSNLAAQSGLPKSHTQQVLLDMKNEALIDVAFDNLYAIVTVTTRGDMLLENLPTRSIGFLH